MGSTATQAAIDIIRTGMVRPAAVADDDTWSLSANVIYHMREIISSRRLKVDTSLQKNVLLL